jgi:hypothetical protein
MVVATIIVHCILVHREKPGLYSTGSSSYFVRLVHLGNDIVIELVLSIHGGCVAIAEAHDTPRCRHVAFAVQNETKVLFETGQ